LSFSWKRTAVQTLSDNLREKIIPVLKEHGVTHAAVFGSLAKGVAYEKSDLDILVDFEWDRTLLDLAALRLDLQKALGRDVDVLTYRSIHPRIREQVLRERVPIL
jgi:predicted nucleotidyltransferase